MYGVYSRGLYKVYVPFSLYDGSNFTVLDMPLYGTVPIIVRSVLRCQR